MTTSSKRLNGAFTERSEHGHFIVNHSINPRHTQGGVQCDGEVSSKSMATRKKYKIVLSEKYVRKSENGKEWFQFPVNISGQLVAIQTIIPLDPYTEPDMEQVKKEAYEDGYKTAKVQCNIQAEKDLREVGERHYQKGLSDAWEAARKIGSNSMCSLEEMGFDFSQCDIPDYNPSWFVVKNYSASECIKKIRQYEEKEEIRVGDEVEDGVANIIVLEINEDGTVSGFDDAGSIIHATPRKKTGRHFPEIATVLAKMKENNENK